MSSVGFARICDPNPESVKFFESGITNEEDLKLQVNEYLKRLQSEPNATGYIINYGTRKEISWLENIFLNEIRFRSFDGSRIIIVNGGYGEIAKTDLWIVPAGATPPTPNYSKAEKKQTIVDPNVRIVRITEENSDGCPTIVERAIKLGQFEAFGNVSDRFFNWIFSDFAENLNLDKTLKGYILIYGNTEETGNALDRIVRLSSVQNIGVDRLIIKNGGNKKKFVIELWILPEDAQSPIQ